jgi:hypothetical protein
VLRALAPLAVKQRFAGFQGTVRMVGQADERGLTDVYVRPARAVKDPRSLLLVLRRRLVEG